MLIDTDVIIWYMRGNNKARQAIDAIERPAISIVSQMELVQGLRNREEQRALHRFLDLRGVQVLPLSETTSQRALFLMEEWRLSHHMMMGDAMIAATAIEYGMTLLTANTKHYEYLGAIEIKRFRP